MDTIQNDKNLLVSIYAAQTSMSKMIANVRDNTVYTKEQVDQIYDVLKDVKEEYEKVTKKYNDLVKITAGRQVMEETLSDKIYADAELHGVKKTKINEVYDLVKRSIKPYILGIQSVEDIVDLEIFIGEKFETLKKLNPKFFENDASYIDPNHEVKAIKFLSRKVIETNTKYVHEKNQVLELKQSQKLREDEHNREIHSLKNEYINLVNDLSLDYGL